MAVALVFLVVIGDDGSETSADALAMGDQQLGPAPDEVDGLSRLVNVDGTDMLVQTTGGDLSFLPGVNLGSAVPGSNPGDDAVTGRQYREWFEQITATGFRVVRIDDLRPPEFYRELADHNMANPQDPLYLIHGLALPIAEATSAAAPAGDLWEPSLRQRFFDRVEAAVSAANGNGSEPDDQRDGGGYTADVGPWIVAWTVGGDLDPQLALRTDDNHAGVTFEGEHFVALVEATPTEAFLAETMDRVAATQAGLGRMIPVAFANRAATDPLRHPDEPDPEQDLVQIDANHIAPADGWAGGTFAAYQAYPYHPDFQRFEPALAEFELDGRLDPFAGYLLQLKAHHVDMPMMVSGFGVPSAHAAARSGPIGRDLGGLDEITQMAVNAEMMQTLADIGMSGGLLRSWIDEWHRSGPNIDQLDGADGRRALWMNAWAAEAHFGLMAAEPGQTPPVVVDGVDDEWDDNGSTRLHRGRDDIAEVRAVHDEGWLYLSIRTDEDISVSEGPLSLGFDVIDGSASELPGGAPERAADYALYVADGEVSLMAAAHADPFRHLQNRVESVVVDEAPTESTVPSRSQRWLGRRVVDPQTGEVFYVPTTTTIGFADGTPEPGGSTYQPTADAVVATTTTTTTSTSLPEEPVTASAAGRTSLHWAGEASGSESWRSRALPVLGAEVNPVSGEPIPVETAPVGAMVRGSTDRSDPLFDSRATWQANGSFLEVRLPWMGLGMSDPSSLRAHVGGGTGAENDATMAVNTVDVERILVTVAVGDRLIGIGEYSWQPWSEVSWHQVPKNGLELVTRAAERTAAQGLRPSTNEE